jgi:hypothetical protein
VRAEEEGLKKETSQRYFIVNDDNSRVRVAEGGRHGIIRGTLQEP